MYFSANDSAVRFSGRWHITDRNATTTAPGGSIICAFQGNWAVLHFDTETNQQPFPHLWLCVDDGPRVEVPLDRFLRVEARGNGNHHIEIIFKSAVERQHRWYQPLIGKVTFCGFEADCAGILPEDTRKVIEFIGDSITEGVLIDVQYCPESIDQLNRVYQDDVTATYAWLTAKSLNMRPVIMGYGATGITVAGQGSVPRGEDAYAYCYNNAPYVGSNADVIVINYGANDRSQKEAYLRGYSRFLDLVRSHNRNAIIVVLSAFYGVYATELNDVVQSYNAEHHDGIIFIDTTGWIPQDPLHPLRDGHSIVAANLTQRLSKMLGICIDL